MSASEALAWVRSQRLDSVVAGIVADAPELPDRAAELMRATDFPAARSDHPKEAA